MILAWSAAIVGYQLAVGQRDPRVAAKVPVIKLPPRAARMTLLAVDEAEMSTVEYSTVLTLHPPRRHSPTHVEVLGDGLRVEEVTTPVHRLPLAIQAGRTPARRRVAGVGVGDED